ncbi:MAG TPA: transcriptional repressor [Candidatus Binataceae bacterium]|nr:transcriptional repressor [Candidatus Binataceae bacterium]
MSESLSISLLRNAGIQPSAQRVAVADYVLSTSDHPTADQVWSKVRRSFPMISRATVYNTLNLFVKKQLLRQVVLDDGKTLFDANVENHHHFVDEETGQIHDIPWDSLAVSKLDSLNGFEVREYHVVMRGRVKNSPRKRA